MVSRSTIFAPATKLYRRWLNTNLVYRLVIVVLFVLFAIGVAGFGVITETENTLSIETEEELRQNADLQHSQTDDWYRSIERDISLVSEAQSLSPDNPTLNNTLNNIQPSLSSSTTAVHYYDTSNSTPELHGTSTQTAPTNPEWKPLLTTNISQTEISRSDIYTTTDTTTSDSTYGSQNSVRMAFVTTDPNNPDHRLILEVDLQQASQQLRAIPDGRSYIINHAGTIVLSSNPSEIGTNAYNNNRITNEHFEQAHISESAFATTQYDQETQLVDAPYATATAHTSEADWVVVSQLDHASAFAVQQNILSLFQPFLIVIVLVVGIAALAVGVPTYRDLQRLTRITNQIQQQNFDVEIPTDRHDEFGDLYRDIEEMRISLEGYISEINNLNNRIQTAVHQQSEVMADVADGNLTQQMDPHTGVTPLDSLANDFNTMVEDVRNMVVEIRQSETELQNFLFIATHDLREPLRMIDSYVGLIEMEYGDKIDGDGEEYLNIISQSAARINAMIEDLYTYLNAETTPDEFERESLNTVVENAQTRIRADIASSNATITVDHLPTVKLDTNRFEDIFEHLLSNAIQYTPDDREPEITITAETNEKTKKHIISISDNGIGIPEDHRDNVFEIFNRLERDESSESTGIGLAIVKRIVEDHGGTIWITADDSQGTTFKLALPMEPQRDSTEFELGDASGVDSYRNDLERRLDE